MHIPGCQKSDIKVIYQSRKIEDSHILFSRSEVIPNMSFLEHFTSDLTTFYVLAMLYAKKNKENRSQLQ